MNTIPQTPWIPHPTILSGKVVELQPLEEAHFAELIAVARERRIWQFYRSDFTQEGIMRSMLCQALVERAQGTQYPFVVYHKAEQRLIGSTRLMDLRPEHQKLEIGFTWLHPAHWATAVNPDCKLLLLRHAFDVMRAARVTLQTDEGNMRSRMAIEKIGATYEGVLRSDLLRDDGSRRSSAYFSILAEEWPDRAARLEQLLESKLAAARPQEQK